MEETREQHIARLKREIADLGSQEAEYRSTHRIEFVTLFPHQQRAFNFVHQGKKVILLQGANQIGKTVFGSLFCGSAGLGIQPWDGRDTVWGPRPLRGRIICSDWEHHAKETIIPELKTWLPAGEYETQRNNIGIEAFWTFPSTGTTLELMTHGQDTQVHESWKGDFVWADEPLPHDKYIANKRGLIARNGVFLLTLTAVSESWILDEIALNPDPSFGVVTQVPIRDNPTLSEDAIRVFEASLTEDQKVARIRGGWLNLVGLIWKGFRTDVHIIDPFKIPTDWPVVPIIDYHTDLPHAVGYYVVDPRNIRYVVDETWTHNSPEEVADDIIRRKKGDLCWRIEDVFIDPLAKGDTEYTKRRGVEIPDSFTVISKKLADNKIRLHVASKDVASGILNIENMLQGVNGMPTLFFFRSLVGKIPREGHIWEIQRWTYKDGKPNDENDHFMENLRRMSLTGVVYKPPRETRLGEVKESYNPLTFGMDGGQVLEVM